MKNYNTLIFDAFDTVVHINLAKLAPCEIRGKTVRTTAPAVHAVYERHFGQLAFDVFYGVFSQSRKDVSKARQTELREISSQERFRIMLEKLDIPDDRIESATLLEFCLAHMEELQKTFEVRPETRQFLDWASSRFRTAMISNFDYSPTLLSALERFGIRSAFEKITVSADIGWRKPHPILFQHTLEEMQIKPSEALFIGDQLYVDVHGALNAGLDVVWLETETQEWVPPQRPEPTYTVRSIMEVIDLLENNL